MLDVFIAATVFCLSYLLTRLMHGYAASRHLLDIPNARSSHDIPTPRGGGLAIAFCFLIALLYYRVTVPFYSPAFGSLFIGGGLVAGIGYWDDHRHIGAMWRILAHCTVSAGTLFLFGGLPDLHFGSYIWHAGNSVNLFGLVALVWLINLYNFMDGIDGIAGVETISVCLCAVFIHIAGGKFEDSFLLIILSAACLGFLAWNWPPAKIFMGDSGSGFLGFVFGVFALQTSSTGSLSLWCWIILLSVFIVDATITLITRIMRGERFYEAHCSHAYQHLAFELQRKNRERGMDPAAARSRGHRTVVMWVAVMNFCWLLPLALTASRTPELGGYLACVAMLPLIVIAIRLGAGKK